MYLKSCEKYCCFEIFVILFRAIMALTFCGYFQLRFALYLAESTNDVNVRQFQGISCAAASLRRAASCIPELEFASQREPNDFTWGFEKR